MNEILSKGFKLGSFLNFVDHGLLFLEKGLNLTFSILDRFFKVLNVVYDLEQDHKSFFVRMARYYYR